MSTSTLFIPTKCKVGFNTRSDTYSGKLGYVIAWDGKKWRKEPSWENWREKYQESATYQAAKRKDFNQRVAQMTKYWQDAVDAVKNGKATDSWTQDRAKQTLDEWLKHCQCHDYSKYTFHQNGKYTDDKSIEPVEFTNEPRSGFVLNRKAGGYSTGWNHRSTYCRVWDPQGFEVEISVPNLLFILQECSSFKGKGLDGEFVYAWDGKDLVLLPTSSEDFKSSAAFTKLQSGKVSTKDLVVGCYYKTKQQEDVMYMGRFPIYDVATSTDGTIPKSKTGKEHVFLNSNKNIVFIPMTSLGQQVTTVAAPDYATLLENMLKDNRFKKVVKFIETPIDFDSKKEGWNSQVFRKERDGSYRQANLQLYKKQTWAWSKGTMGETNTLTFSGWCYNSGYAIVDNHLVRFQSARRSNSEQIEFQQGSNTGKDFVLLKAELEDGTIINLK